MLSLRKEELKSYQDLKVCSICREKSLKSLLKIKITEKSQIIVITQVNIEAEHIVFVIQNLTCVYKSLHFFITVQIIKELEFIIKELQNEFEEQFECLGENKEKWKTLSVPIKKEITKIDKDGNEVVVNISYKTKSIDSAKFMASSLSNLVDHLAEGIHKIKGKEYDSFLEYENVKEDLIEYKYLSCNKDYSNRLDEKNFKKIKNTFKLYNYDINEFILLLGKCVFPYEYMDDWEKFNETTLPEKEQFYSNLNMEEITDADYMHRERACKDFEIEKLGEYHDLYLKKVIHYF